MTMYGASQFAIDVAPGKSAATTTAISRRLPRDRRHGPLRNQDSASWCGRRGRAAPAEAPGAGAAGHSGPPVRMSLRTRLPSCDWPTRCLVH
jgi:hypothetical protein